jgi:hypothetical protein
MSPMPNHRRRAKDLRQSQTETEAMTIFSGDFRR